MVVHSESFASDHVVHEDAAIEAGNGDALQLVGEENTCDLRMLIPHQLLFNQFAHIVVVSLDLPHYHIASRVSADQKVLSRVSFQAADGLLMNLVCVQSGPSVDIDEAQLAITQSS